MCDLRHITPFLGLPMYKRIIIVLSYGIVVKLKYVSVCKVDVRLTWSKSSINNRCNDFVIEKLPSGCKRYIRGSRMLMYQFYVLEIHHFPQEWISSCLQILLQCHGHSEPPSPTNVLMATGNISQEGSCETFFSIQSVVIVLITFLKT